jgi:fatty acid desaturase
MKNQNETLRDYSLVGHETEIAKQNGLDNAVWYLSPVPRDKMRELLVRKDGPAIRDTLLWFGLIFGSGYLVFLLRGTWYSIFPYILHSALYASTSDSRWHESLTHRRYSAKSSF